MSINFNQTEDPNQINISIKDINLSLVNGIRRTILSDYPTIAFNTDEYLNSDLKILTNTSSINNEYILHRLGLVPIHSESVKSFDSSKYKFIIDKQNITNYMISIKSNDFKVINTETGNEEDSIKFFPPDPITNDFILILKLKQNPNKIGENLHLEGKASVGTGAMNSRFSPVSCVTFKNIIDPDKYEKALKVYLDKTLSKDDQKNIKKETLNFELAHGERFFYTNEKDEPNAFELYIESLGVIPPHIILYETLDIIKKKINSVATIISKIITEKIEDEQVQITKSLDTMDAYEVKIINESHTLGNIIQSYATDSFTDEELPFIGYKNPHPLKKFIVIKLKTKNNTMDEINNVFTKTNDTVNTVISNIKKEIETKYKLKKTLKVKKSPKTSKTPTE